MLLFTKTKSNKLIPDEFFHELLAKIFHQFVDCYIRNITQTLHDSGKSGVAIRGWESLS